MPREGCSLVLWLLGNMITTPRSMVTVRASHSTYDIPGKKKETYK